MTDAAAAHFPKPVHNFGIFKKSGKRAILQFDFKNSRLNIIKQGVMKHSFDFEQLLQYESEEGLNLIIKCVNKDFEFDAGSTEEKHTICRLLGMILYGGNLDPMSVQVQPSTESDSEVQQRRSRSVIKEGILEKKGNTAIPMWAKRKVLVTPGEFSYFRPDEEVALNIIHLWTDDCKIKPYSNNGFAVQLTNRTYYFRVLSDGKAKDKNSQRYEWITAFEKACKLKRATVMLFGQEGGISHPCINRDHDLMSNLQPIHNLSPSLIRAVQSKSFDDEFCNDVDFNDRNNTDEELIDSEGEPLDYPDYEKEEDRKEEYQSECRNTPTTKANEDVYNVRLSTVSPTTPLSSLTADRPKPPSSRRLHPHPSNRSPESEDGTINEETEFSDEVVKSNEKYKHEQITVTKINKSESSEKYADNKGIGETKSDIDHVVRLQTEEINNNSSTCDISNSSPQRENILNTSSQRENFEEVQEKETAKQIPEENTKSDSICPTREENIPVPPPPVPPPPLHYKKSVLKSGRVSNRKLKQVHWTMVPKLSINNSLWRKAVDLTGRLNTEQLELLFSVSDVATASSSGPKKDKGILIDAKRAQNISILMKGLKTDGARSLHTILNSVKEDESFPAEKITTIRRYQPNQDEIEMYKSYSSRRNELHPVDQFMLELCEIKCLSIRLDLALILWDYPRQMDCVNQTVDTLLKACTELLKSESLVSVLYYILAIGNYMNSRYQKMDKGFQLTSCERFMDIRGSKSKYTLLHFLVDQLIASDPEVLNWTSSVSSVKKCQNLSVKLFSAEIEVLKSDLNKMKKALKTLNKELKSPTHEDTSFFKKVQANKSLESSRWVNDMFFVPEYSNRNPVKISPRVSEEKMLSERETELEQLTSKCGHVQQKYRQVLEKFGESSFLPSDQFFSSVSRFIEQFEQTKSECLSSVPIV